MRALATALDERAVTELHDIGDDHWQANPRRSLARLAIRRLSQAVLLDPYEPEARRRLGGWAANVDAALLVGYPFSTVTVAAERLRRASVPYVVDLGDPWVLTAVRGARRWGPQALRGLRRERSLWAHAAGAIAPTAPLAADLTRHFPALPTLVRPSGYEPVPAIDAPPIGASSAARVLRLVHYGELYRPRLAIGSFLAGLVSAGRWQRIELAVFGSVFDDALGGTPPQVSVSICERRPWRECVASARAHDVALVVGNTDPRGLPSKAVQYLTLPIPRLALVSGDREDQLAAYVAGRPGWLALSASDQSDRAVAALAGHVERQWTRGELAPPASEAWPAVASEILGFVARQTGITL
jgi:hypothetical protein